MLTCAWSQILRNYCPNIISWWPICNQFTTSFYRLSEISNVPNTHCAIIWIRYYIISNLGSSNIEWIYWIFMTICRNIRSLNRSCFYLKIPNENLTIITTSNYLTIWIRKKFSRSNWRLAKTMELRSCS